MKKIFFLFLMVNFTLFSDDQNLARYYLVKANESFKNGDFELAINFLEKSYGYYQYYPEYYYLQNQLFDSKRENLFKKNINAQKILQYIDNQFFINKYTMLKDSFLIFKKTLDYTNSSKAFTKISGLENIDLLDDYLGYMELLANLKDYDNLENQINLAKSRYESLEIEFYSIFADVNKKKFDVNKFNEKIDILYANSYSKAKILYLKTFFYNDGVNIRNLFNEYKNLKNNNDLDKIYSKDILFNLINKFSFFNKSEQRELLKEWIDINGLNDVRTEDILKDSKILNFIKNDKEFSNKFLLFDGIRLKDIDRDSNWEEFYEYKNGNLILNIFDSNQDGLYESKIEYSNSRIKFYYEYFNEGNENYKKYNFNVNDNSINSLEYYINNKIKKRVNLIKSSFKPDINKFKGIKDSEIVNFIDNIEYFDLYYSVERYKNGRLLVKLIDSNNNNVFDIREEYNNGIKERTVKDLNENGFFELIENYSNGRLATIFYSTDESSGKYDYKEIISENRIVKYWDTNLDGIFEISVEEGPDFILTKFDINFDSNYDIIYEKKNNVTNVYRVIKGESKLINSYKEGDMVTKKGWIIASVKDIDKIELPENIDLVDKKNLNGFFYHKDKKYYFENGIIKNQYINFVMFLLENKIYLIDQMGAK